MFLGALKRKQIPKIGDYYGSGWLGPGLTQNYFLENHPKIALNQYFGVVSGLEIRVVLWPQSTKTSVGPPDCARWWSGGLLENSP